jgi:hypothetical protein
MYTISKDPNGFVLLCHDCPNVERVIDLCIKNAIIRRQAIHRYPMDTTISNAMTLSPSSNAAPATRGEVV